VVSVKELARRRHGGPGEPGRTAFILAAIQNL
jgi:hypothetical protein